MRKTYGIWLAAGLCGLIGLFILAGGIPASFFSAWGYPGGDPSGQMPPMGGGMGGGEAGDEISKAVLKRMKEDKRDNDLETIKAFSVGNVVVVHEFDMAKRNMGFDQVQSVLMAFGITYTGIGYSDIATHDFGNVDAVLINCTEQQLSDASVKKLKDYITSGGYLFTTDWCLDRVIEKVAPGYLKHNKAGLQKPKRTVSIAPTAAGAKHPFLRGVFPKDFNDPKWVLDGGCQSFVLGDGNRPITILIESEEMKKDYKTNLIAATWEMKSGYKKGVILHVVSHFAQQNLGYKDKDSLSSMYQLVINFLLEAKYSKLKNKK